MALNYIKYSFIFLGAAILAGGCTQENSGGPFTEEPSDTVNSISLEVAPRYAAEGIDLNDPDIIYVNDFGEGSIIYISQMGTVVDPAFSSTAQNNLYPYKWYENDEADWDNEYNFQPIASTIYWDDVADLGQVGNSFSFYGMYFPVDQTAKFNVQTDQTTLNNFQLSDILGAYHATSSLFSRLRFRFFHLMVYLKVTLYVPIYQIDSQDVSSGYDADAVLDTYLVNPYTEFGINWRANRSSDTEAPLVIIPSNSAKGNIYVYQHPVTDDVTTIDVGDYYKGGLTQDQVRAYEFSVLFPPQSFNDNILCFQLQTPGQQNAGTTEKYVNYYFKANQLVSQSQDFRFTQGTLQHLSLYLPRFANETVLIGAEIIDWTNASTGMTVVEQSDSNNSGNGD